MANRPLDLLGKKFNMLTVVEVAHRNGGVHWLCECDCGGQKIVHGPEIKAGVVKSCGCLLHMPRGPQEDITGMRFGRLVVQHFVRSPTGRGVEWVCLCDCGGTTTTRSSRLKNGTCRSCGCFRTDTHTTHGRSTTREYRVWSSMKDRCYNEKSNRWHTHGARGVRVCDRWLNSFENFMEDMGPRPTTKHSLERVDNNGNYEPENCVWATDTEQAENRRTTRRFTHQGKTQSLKAWCRELGVPYLRTYKRIVYRNWSFEEAIK